MTGSGKSSASSTIGAFVVAERVAGGRLLEADGGDDVAGEDGVDVLAVVGVHLEDAADALLAVLGRVEDAGALLERARVDAEVGELADVRVAHDLERQGRRTARCRRPARSSSSMPLMSMPLIGGRSSGLGQEVDDGVEHGLHALVLERRAAQHGDDLVGDGAVAQRLAEVVGGDLLLAEVLLDDDVVEVATARRSARGATSSACVGEVGGDVDDVQLLARVFDVSSQTSAFISMRSTTPLKWPSAPIGSWTTATVASSRSLIDVDGARRSRRRCGPSC